ncbi:SpoIIE family protein phosphatase [Streptomyces sp. SID486]|uniref:ATP-binding SpoIIE family protein phosphatase n=1 Tax=Streptomyces sp. SID486 TaxID=2690264 RepID=UPI00136CCF33|nr:ATP-binding SpoIIE family protein phosphatase [Streptomyces sp. SID486]MYX95978.1 SpoIIE family protein phosphatase [Streptomyces sp. SID486]
MNDRTNTYSTLDRDRVLADTLQDVIGHLGANTAMAYLLADDHTLRAVVIGGAQPAIYTMPEHIDIDEPFATAAAYRTGTLATAGFPTAAASSPGMRLASRVPFPYSVVSLPIDTEDDRVGVLTVVWVPPRAHPLPAGDVSWLHNRTGALARTLGTLARHGVDMHAGALPAVLPLYGRAATRRPGTDSGWGLPGHPGSAEVSFMYQLHQLAAELNEATSVSDVMTVTRHRVMAPFGATAFLVHTLKEGRLWIAGHSGYPTTAVRLLHGAAATDHRPDAHALHSHTPLYFESRNNLLQDYPHAVEDDLEATVHLPITPHNQPLGVCTLGFPRTRVFSPEEQAVAMLMMDLLGPALERATLTESARQLAEHLQKKLLPRRLVEVPGMITTARYLPAASAAGLGGDWYDMIPLPGSRIALVVGDVEGHSVDSSIVMGQLRSAVRAYATEGHTPGVTLTRANRLLAELDTDLMATCCLVTLDTTTGTAEIATAGHPPPLIRASDGSLTTPGLPPGLPLGIAPDTPYTTTDISLTPETLLLLYTDGLTENRPLDASPYTRTLLTPPLDTVDHLADHLIDHATAHHTHHDDIALLVAHYEGPHAGPHRRINHIHFHRHDLNAVSSARQFIADSLHTWGLDDLIDDTRLLTSEIVTNALIHADSDVDVRLREYPDHLRLEVHDTDPTPAIPTPITLTLDTNQHAEHGRGLLIVDALATQWGNTPSGRGKTIWVDIDNHP